MFQALQVIPQSILIWAEYLNFIEAVEVEEGNIREAFEEAVKVMGKHYDGWKIWNMYINFERGGGNMMAVCMLYNRVIRIPNRDLEQQVAEISSIIEQRQNEETRAMRIVREVFDETKEEKAKIECYEDRVTKGSGDLAAWQEYIGWMEAEGGNPAIMDVLMERAKMDCGNDEEFWLINYMKWWKGRGMVSEKVNKTRKLYR